MPLSLRSACRETQEWTQVIPKSGELGSRFQAPGPRLRPPKAGGTGVALREPLEGAAALLILPAVSAAAHSSGSRSPTAQRSARLLLRVVPRWQAPDRHTRARAHTLNTHTDARTHARTPNTLAPFACLKLSGNKITTGQKTQICPGIQNPWFAELRPPEAAAPQPLYSAFALFSTATWEDAGQGGGRGASGLGLQASCSASYRPESTSPAAACAEGWTNPLLNLVLSAHLAPLLPCPWAPQLPFVSLAFLPPGREGIELEGLGRDSPRPRLSLIPLLPSNFPTRISSSTLGLRQKKKTLNHYSKLTGTGRAGDQNAVPKSCLP